MDEQTYWIPVRMNRPAYSGAGAGGGPLGYKLNFRSTTAFVTDGGGQTKAISNTDLSAGDAEAYPTTRNGITFGNTSGAATIVTRDRVNTNVKMAGMWFNENGNADDIRIDLANGNYTLRFAMGDPSNAQATVAADIRDGSSTSLFTISGSTSAADHYLDATGVERTSEADWNANNVGHAITIASGFLVIRIGNGAAVNTGWLSHVQIDSA